MGTKHKHYDVIVAWAAGEEIEWMGPYGRWEKIRSPNWVEDQQYRIKPKRVKKEGWVNVYPGNFLCYFHSKVHADKSDEVGKDKRVACVRIEWEEEDGN